MKSKFQPVKDASRSAQGRQAGFQARSVVGGLYIKMLADPALRKKWSARHRPR
jgi:hypothetical protein